MTPRERALYLRFQRRAAAQSPDMAKALLDAYRQIRDTLSPAEIERLIASGQLDRIIDDATLDRAVIKVRERIVESVQQGFKATVRDLPKAGLVQGTPAISFDVLSPKVIEGVRALDSRVMNTIKDEIKETVRAHVENGLRDGKGPREIVRGLRSTIGLSPTQAQYVANYRRALESGDVSKALGYGLRDRRFDGTVRGGGGMVRLYRAEVPFTAKQAAEWKAHYMSDPTIGREMVASRGRWFADSREQVQLYADRPGARVYAVDVPRSVAMRARSVDESWTEYRLPRKYADAKRLLEDMPNAPGGGLSPEKIDRMVAAYEKRMTAFHAETVSRTATLDSMKLGQRLSWEDAARKGIVDRGLLQKKWITVQDDRVRPEHKLMHGESVPFDNTFSNGDTIPGESDFNCRCIARYFQASPSTITP